MNKPTDSLEPGWIDKGGHNGPPTTPHPANPKGMNPHPWAIISEKKLVDFLTIHANLASISCFQESPQLKKQYWRGRKAMIKDILVKLEKGHFKEKV